MSLMFEDWESVTTDEREQFGDSVATERAVRALSTAELVTLTKEISDLMVRTRFTGSIIRDELLQRKGPEETDTFLDWVQKGLAEEFRGYRDPLAIRTIGEMRHPDFFSTPVMDKIGLGRLMLGDNGVVIQPVE